MQKSKVSVYTGQQVCAPKKGVSKDILDPPPFKQNGGVSTPWPPPPCLRLGVVKGKKYFFLNRYENFQNDFFYFETPSLAVSKFLNA